MTDSKTICYCFGYTENDIVNDLKHNDGKSVIFDIITKAKRNNQCQCDINHPEKR